MCNILVVPSNYAQISLKYRLISSKICNVGSRALPYRYICARDVSQIVYVTDALLKKARIGGIFANNCYSDVNNPRRTGYIKYHWTDIGCTNVNAPVT